MQHRLLTKGLALAAGLLLAATTITPATAGPEAPNRGRYSAVGDSYAAGVGNAASEAYPVLLAGSPRKVNFLAESGATTQIVLTDQVPLIPPSATQVTLTVGGNDIGFAQIALTCAADPANCGAAISAAGPALAGLNASLPALIEAVQARAPRATVYVTGYPQLFQPDLALANPCVPFTGVPLAALVQADGAIATLNGVIAGAAASEGAVYVDIAGEFEGFGLCTAPGALIYAPIPSGTGFDEASLHPTALGQQAYADAIEEAGFVTG